MPTTNFTEDVKNEVIDKVLDSGTIIGEVIKTLRHTSFKADNGAFDNAMKTLESIEGLKKLLDSIPVED